MRSRFQPSGCCQPIWVQRRQARSSKDTLPTLRRAVSEPSGPSWRFTHSAWPPILPAAAAFSSASSLDRQCARSRQAGRAPRVTQGATLGARPTSPGPVQWESSLKARFTRLSPGGLEKGKGRTAWASCRQIISSPLPSCAPWPCSQHLRAGRQGDPAGPSGASGKTRLKHPRLGPLRSTAPRGPVPAPHWERATEPLCTDPLWSYPRAPDSTSSLPLLPALSRLHCSVVSFVPAILTAGEGEGDEEGNGENITGLEDWCVQSPGPAALRNRIITIEASCVARVLRWDTGDAGELMPAFTRSFSFLLAYSTGLQRDKVSVAVISFLPPPWPWPWPWPWTLPPSLPEQGLSLLLSAVSALSLLLLSLLCSPPCSLALRFFLDQVLAQSWDGLVSPLPRRPTQAGPREFLGAEHRAVRLSETSILGPEQQTAFHKCKGVMKVCFPKCGPGATWVEIAKGY